ncbi:MAG: magnesium/cobalt transporter CorA [Candidatus Omnitrophica bacterium]|nr:magnesium/cobalt transporter CorA [Candidatus Omnitrophota bacterium]
MYEAFQYKDGKLKRGLDTKQIEQALKDKHSLLWVDIQAHDDGDIAMLKDIFKLHPVTLEDCMMPNARPKLEKFKDYLFMIMFAIELHPEQKEEIKTVELDCCLGSNFILTMHADNLKSVTTIKSKIERQESVIADGVDFLLCSIVDTMVDNYFPIITMFDDRVDDVSDELFKEPTQQTLNKIYNLKNEILFLRRTVGPQADVISLMIRGGYEYVTTANIAYFRNVYDNLVRLNDIIGTSRDIITSALEAYTSVVSNRLNEIMKTLTVIATIMMPLTLIASIYGMNFKFMPELASEYGYPIAIGIMVAIAVVMLSYFKRKKWL